MSFKEKHVIPILNGTAVMLLGALLLYGFQQLPHFGKYTMAATEPDYGGVYAEPYGHADYSPDARSSSHIYDTFTPQE